MARRKSSKMKKFQPVPLKLNFIIPNASQTTSFIDISQCVSAVSRKFLRQGLNWAVSGGRILLPPAAVAANGNAAYIATLPHTWCVSNGWHKAQAHWLRQQNEALDEAGSESATAAFRDFKIFADTDHVTAGFGANLLPFNMGPGTTLGPYPSNVVSNGPVASGEWQASQIVVPNVIADASGSLVDPFEYYLHMVGPNNSGAGSRGIVEGYADSRAYPQSPDPAAPNVHNDTNWFKQMFDVGNDDTEVLDNATKRNDDLPYDQVNYPGGENNFSQLENQGFVLNTNTIGITEYKFTGFTAPCGLIRLDTLGNDTSNPNQYPIVLELELMPGDHRGYMAEPMQEM